MSAFSAGLLMYRRPEAGLQVLLAHPGGPFFVSRDEGAWTLPKGAVEPGEEPLQAARREFTEETGFASVPPFLPLGEVRQKSGKRVQAWAFEGDCDPVDLVCSAFELEWPPRTGRFRSFPEIDRLGWFDVAHAHRKIMPAQALLLDRLVALVGTAERP